LRLASLPASSLVARRAPWSFSLRTGVAGSPPGSQSNMRRREAMAVKLHKNSRDFTLSWEDFEKAFYRVKGHEEVDDIDILKKAGNC